MPEMVQLGRLWNLINWTTLKYLDIFHPRLQQEERYRRFMKVRTFFNPELAIGQHEATAPIKVGRLQFEYLKKCGLKPQHSLLDYGCGALRLGRYAIPYVAPGHYYGLDISESVVAYADRLAAKCDLSAYKPTLRHIETSSIPFDNNFDFIIAQSVFTHTDPSTTLVIMRAVSEHMHESSRFLATFWIRDEFGESRKVNYYYPVRKILEMAEESGLISEFKDDYEHPSQKMVIFSKLTSTPPSAV